MSTETENTAESAENTETKVDLIPKTEHTKITTELQTALRQREDETNNLKKSLEAYGGVTPEQVAEWKRAQKEQETAEAVRQAEGKPDELNKLWETREAEIREEAFAEVSKYKTQLESISSKYKQVTVVSQLMNEFGAGVLDKARPDIEAEVSRYVDANENGEVTIRDDRGNVRYSPTEPSRKMNAREFFAELEDRKDYCFRAKGINKGSIMPGQTVSNTASNSAGSFDIQRYQTDSEYRNSFSRSERVKLDRQLKI